MKSYSPLAFKIRPESLDDIIGQAHLVGQKGALRKSLDKKMPFSFILFGPPGSGKTTIALSYAKAMKMHHILINAVTTDKKEMVNAIEDAKLYGQAIIIVDEVHRLDKAKQDLLLPYVENGLFYLIGATTANPYIALSRAIRSRCRIFELHELSDEEVYEGLLRGVKALGSSFKVSEEALRYIARLSGGDLRYSYNMLEQVYIASEDNVEMRLEDVEAIERVPNLLSDKDEEEHYDSVSALQKSIRGQDVDAALYYLARLCAANDLDSIKRRLLVTAYEDIGLANPPAVMRAQLAIKAAEEVGFPEAVIPLGNAVIELCLSPHSKAGNNAIHAALEVASSTPLKIRDYLKLTPVSLKEEEKYPYDRPDLWKKMVYLPEGMEDMSFYEPNYESISTYEKALNEQYKRLKAIHRSSNLAALKKTK